ncbi:MAG: 6-carboxytetrahydropterin synthase [candidate division Zixibacteria bacterium]|nr:6-carboxytetrahydropterin synthase [candidate division Zixibacteria bacterium]
MYLTLSKRFEFCASHRCYVPEWSEAQNFDAFGDESRGEHGHGHNYDLFLIFHGQVDAKTGMMINFSDIKEKVNKLLAENYDHKYINQDTAAFSKMVPTEENLAGTILSQAKSLFQNHGAQPVVCHLNQSAVSSATAFADGRAERCRTIHFSVARRTYSPHMSEEENLKLFGISAAPSGHGHNYRLNIVWGENTADKNVRAVSEGKVQKSSAQISSELDHKNLNVDVPGLKGEAITTETLARHIWKKLEQQLPLKRIRLYENPDFFVECHGENAFFMGVATEFSAAHRLHSGALSAKENEAVYGKCNNPSGHGHQYRVECTVAGKLDEKSGTVMDLMKLNGILSGSISTWSYKNLDMEAEEFKNKPSTGENIVTALWKKLESTLGNKLYRLRLWETPNNRFTIRREVHTT